MANIFPICCLKNAHVPKGTYLVTKHEVFAILDILDIIGIYLCTVYSKCGKWKVIFPRWPATPQPTSIDRKKLTL